MWLKVYDVMTRMLYGMLSNIRMKYTLKKATHLYNDIFISIQKDNKLIGTHIYLHSKKDNFLAAILLVLS